MKGEKKLLCFPGGGLKGVMQLKFLKYFESKYNIKEKTWILDNVDIFCGTSVGSIIVFFILLQYSLDEIINIMDELAYSTFRKKGLLKYFSKDIVGIIFDNPYNFDELRKIFIKAIIDSPLNKKIINGEIILDGINSLNEDNFYFYHLNIIYPDKEFYVFAVNGNTNKIQIYNSKQQEITQNCQISNDSKIIDSILSSASAPFYFKNKFLKICNKFRNIIDGGVGGLNCAAHIGLLGKKENCRVLIINHVENLDKFKDNGFASLLYMLQLGIGRSSESHSFIISYFLTEGRLRSIFFKKTDRYKIFDGFDIKSYELMKKLFNDNKYLDSILKKNDSIDELFGIKNKDKNKFLNNEEWIRDFFFNSQNEL